MTATATRSTTAAEPISAAQRRALFAIGQARGLTIDDLRDLTPAGSISMLTRADASRLLDSLNRGTDYKHPRRPMTQIDSTVDAIEVIELLKQVLSRTLKARRRGTADGEPEGVFEGHSNGD